MGSACLLLDEDTCASNFMFRDARMQVLFSMLLYTAYTYLPVPQPTSFCAFSRSGAPLSTS